ncbi:uncharacterized protein DS421_9g271460 [Arachis hypogaea]|nr:uncharacterized protein DS421_9g271460 [Arachis hypogaea]
MAGAVAGVLGPPEPPPELPATSAIAKNCRDWNPSPLLLEVAAGLPPSRFGDRHCVGSTVPPSVRLSFGYCMLQLVLLWLPRKWLRAEVAVVGNFSLREEVPVALLGYGICVLR